MDMPMGALKQLLLFNLPQQLALSGNAIGSPRVNQEYARASRGRHLLSAADLGR